MSEIDPQFEHLRSEDSPTEAKLSHALRHLAASSRQGAPAEIGAGLAMAFRRHHRHKRIRRMSIAGLVAVAILVSSLLLRRSQNTSPTTQATATQATTPQPAQNATQAHIEPASTPTQATEASQTASVPVESPKSARKLSRPKVTTSTVAYSREFVALPGYDPEVPPEDLHIVRAQLPTSTLWQMGAPINPTGLDRKVLADFVIGQDGTPYGVRLVHTTIF